MNAVSRALLTLGILGLAGCPPDATDAGSRADAGLDRGLDAGTDAGSDGPEDAGPLVDAGATLVSYQSDIRPIFRSLCLDCHFAGAYLELDTPDGAGLFAAHSFPCAIDGDTVNLNRVQPGSLELSALWWKVTDLADPADFTLECGREMPLGQPEGSLVVSHPEHVATIEAWILQGANVD